MKVLVKYAVSVIVLMIVHYEIRSQDVSKTFNIQVKDQPIEIVLDSISYKTGFYFSYNSDIIPSGSLYSLSLFQVDINQAIRTLFEGTYIVHTFINDQVILRERPDQYEIRNIEETYTLSGWVTEDVSSEEIPGVNVYLDGTSLGGVTNKNGFYRIERIPVGNYDLIFSHVGYVPNKYRLAVNGEGKLVINSKLSLKTTNLPEIEIVANPIAIEDLERYRDIFLYEFFGSSPNANSCLLMNPGVLNFTFEPDEEILKVGSNESLLIRNDALGYMITYDLDFFENKPDEVKFFGNIRFENLPNATSRDKRKWKKNRKKSYNGSLRHFLVSLSNGTLKKEGFQLYLVDETSKLDPALMKPVKPSEIISPSTNSLEWIVTFDRFLHVEYIREKEDELYLRHLANSFLGIGGPVENQFLFATREPGNQRSLLKLKEGRITVDANGRIVEPRAITTFGYWSWERFADLLPLEYDPKNDEF